MEEFEIEEKYSEMHIDEMKAVKEVWKSYFKMAKNNLKHIQCIEETKENRWELKTLEMSYCFFIDQIKKIVKIYSALINLAEDCDLEEHDFLKAMQAVKIINKELHIEVNKKSFKELNIKYIESLRPAKDLTNL